MQGDKPQGTIIIELGPAKFGRRLLERKLSRWDRLMLRMAWLIRPIMNRLHQKVQPHFGRPDTRRVVSRVHGPIVRRTGISLTRITYDDGTVDHRCSQWAMPTHGGLPPAGDKNT